MNKPFTLQVLDAEEKIISVINETKMPVFVLKKILENIYKQLEEIDIEEINKYNKESESEK